jgi:uncharacterized protein (DUF305 family)
MRTFLIILAASAALAGCSDRDNGDEHADTSGAAHHDSASDSTAMMHTQMDGDMMERMGQMNAMMVGMLGAADSTYEQRFIDLMIPHHMGAVHMAEDALQKATHPELKQFAQSVIDAQQKEIALMKSWRQQWYSDSTIVDMGAGASMDMHGMDQQMMSHLGAADSTYDQRFIDMMIPHHEGAVMMAQDAQSKSTRKELRDLASTIIADQNSEIAQLRGWRSQWYGR